MRFLLLSKAGSLSPIAYRLAKEGHSVDMWIEDKSCVSLMSGFVNRPTSWRPIVADADMVICDSGDFAQYESLFKRLGKPVLGCNAIGDVLENNAQKLADVFSKFSITHNQSVVYPTITDAANLIWANDAGYDVVIAGTTYRCENEDLYLWLLSTHSAAQDITVIEVIDGITVVTTGWFNGLDWIQPFSHTMPCIGGNVTLPIEKADKLTQSTLARFKPLLSRAGYRGPISVECIVNSGAVYARKMYCGFTHNAFASIMTSLNEELSAFLFYLAGGLKTSIDMRYDFLIEVGISCSDAHHSYGMPIGGLTETDLKFTYPIGAQFDAANEFKCSATSSDILIATAFGRSITEAQHRVYKICKNIQGINLEYSHGVGDAASKDIATLREWGWL